MIFARLSKSRRLRPLPALILAVLMAAATALQAADTTIEEMRQWTSFDGKVLTAAVVSISDDSVTLDRRDGSTASVIPRSRLTFEDQAYLAGLRALLDPSPPALQWPGKVSAQADAILGERTDASRYRSKHFEFLSGYEITSQHATDAATVHEATLAAVRALPLDLPADPPKGWQRFVVTLTARSNFDELTAGSALLPPGDPIAAGYFRKERQLLVSFDAFPSPASSPIAIPLANKLPSPALPSVIHEISHQVTENFLYALPHWLSEGLAEYLALVPYDNGEFDFSRAEEGLKHSLQTRYPSPAPPMLHPSGLITAANVENWSGSVEEHRTAMLIVYFLIHLDGKDAASPYITGTHLVRATRVLRGIDRHALQLIEAYNEAVTKTAPLLDAYDADFKRFQEKAKAYNKMLADIRAGRPVVIEGGDGSERVVVGSKPPPPPVRPTLPEIPEILKHQRNGVVQVSGFGRELLLAAVLRGRSVAQFTEDMAEAYRSIGIELSIAPPGAAK